MAADPFETVCAKVARWPPSCAGDPVRDVLLRAGKEAFNEESPIREAMRVLYARFPFFRPLVDLSSDPPPPSPAGALGGGRLEMHGVGATRAMPAAADGLDPHEVAKFQRVCAKVQAWPGSCPDNPEWDLMLKAGKDAFREGTNVHAALRILYVRNGMLRPVVDMLCNCFTDQFCARYGPAAASSPADISFA